MAQSTFSLLWESHKNNICTGLSALQQNEEFVDMTLAADGHHVKVHQMVMALASPYIKELISSANCPHPVIFLNKISYTTLRAILEYIYTGEVLISVEHLSELLHAARELHIKGLEEMNVQEPIAKHNNSQTNSMVDEENTENMEDEICYFEVGSRVHTPSQKSNCTIIYEGISEDSQSLNTGIEENYEEIVPDDANDEPYNKKPRLSPDEQGSLSEQAPTVIQYTISNQGSLQMILNRYVYYLKHSNRNKSRQWRCVDYLNTIKCPAIVFTKNDVVLQRISAHTHPFHDRRILSKVRAGAVYTALHDAEAQGNIIKNKTKIKLIDN